MHKILLVITLLTLVGCIGKPSDGDRFDKLHCVIGNGDILLLKHHIGDTYFIDVLREEEDTHPSSEINRKLYE